MAESKRDYYEVLGVSKDADDDALKKAYRKLAKKYHPVPIPETRRQRPNLKRHLRLTACSAILRSASSMTSSAMPPLSREAEAQEGLAASAVLTLAVRIWEIFLEIFLEISLAAAVPPEEEAVLQGAQM